MKFDPEKAKSDLILGDIGWLWRLEMPLCVCVCVFYFDRSDPESGCRPQTAACRHVSERKRLIVEERSWLGFHRV